MHYSQGLNIPFEIFPVPLLPKHQNQHPQHLKWSEYIHEEFYTNPDMQSGLPVKL